MRKLVCLLILGLPMAAVRPSGAQPPPPPSGSLTVLSRPAGAVVKLNGPQRLVGRTPITLSRGISGRYRITATATGYEPSRRMLTVDGARTDTVWMSFRPKHVARAVVRSMVVPGWGQFYNERPGHAWTVATVAATAGTTLLVSQIQYRDKLRLFNELDAIYRANPTPARQLIRNAALEETARARDFRRNMAHVAIGVYAANLIDAVVFGPAHRKEPVAFGIEPISGDGAMAVVRVRF